MTDAGYTLVETMAALMMLGLAIGGLSMGVHVLGLQQARANEVVGEVQALQQAELRLERLLLAGGAFRSNEPDRLSGDARRLRFTCGQPRDCTAELLDDGRFTVLVVDDGEGVLRRLSLRTPGPGRFSYRGRFGETADWPPEASERQALEAITIWSPGGGGGSGIALLVADVQAAQPAACAFDPVLQDCR